MLGRKMFYSAVLMVVAALAVALAAGCSAVSRPAVSAGVQAVPAGGGPSGTQPVALIGQSSQPVAPTNRGITVVGMGKASGTPDVANINVGVETQAASVQQAVDDNKAKMTKLLDALKSLGIADKDIRTSNYGVYTERQPVPARTARAARADDLPREQPSECDRARCRQIGRCAGQGRGGRREQHLRRQL